MVNSIVAVFVYSIVCAVTVFWAKHHLAPNVLVGWARHHAVRVCAKALVMRRNP